MDASARTGFARNWRSHRRAAPIIIIRIVAALDAGRPAPSTPCARLCECIGGRANHMPRFPLPGRDDARCP